MAKNLFNYKLGKLPARFDPRTLQFAKYYVAPSYPPSRKWSSPLSKLGMMANDQIGDCTMATSGHHVQVWSANNGNQIIIPDSSIIKAYSDVSGYDPDSGLNDNGCVELDVLNYLRKTGIDGRKIFAFTQVDLHRIDLIKAAIDRFGGIRLCARLPLSAQGQKKWLDPKGNFSGRNKRGSWGGHSFLGVDYDETYVYVITWGMILPVEWGWLTSYGDEFYAVLSMDWIKNNVAPNDFNLDQLEKDLASI